MTSANYQPQHRGKHTQVRGCKDTGYTLELKIGHQVFEVKACNRSMSGVLYTQHHLEKALAKLCTQESLTPN